MYLRRCLRGIGNIFDKYRFRQEAFLSDCGNRGRGTRGVCSLVLIVDDTVIIGIDGDFVGCAAVDDINCETETETADRTESMVVDKPSLDAAKPVCQVCNKEIESSQEKTIGVWTLCNQCHADLVFQPPKPAAPKDLSEEDDDALKEETAESDAMPVGRVKIDMTKTIDCHGCG